MHADRTKKLSNAFAISALVAYVAALILPAIHERGYYDSQLGDIEPHTIAGFACAIGLCFSAWFVGLHFFYLIANIMFVLLTPLLFRTNTELSLVRWLLMLTATVAPIHLITFSFQRAMVGAYFWLFAFFLSSIAHWMRFISTTTNSPSHVTPTSPMSAG